MTREPIRHSGHGRINPMGWEPPHPADRARRRLGIAAAALVVILAALCIFA